MPGDWSRLEVEATVADYLDMFESELRDEPYVKAEHNRRLRALLDDRSKGAVERKHQNISAILLELGLPYISGYKPLSNYQQLLFDGGDQGGEVDEGALGGRDPLVEVPGLEQDAGGDEQPDPSSEAAGAWLPDD